MPGTSPRSCWAAPVTADYDPSVVLAGIPLPWPGGEVPASRAGDPGIAPCLQRLGHSSDLTVL